MCWAFSGTQAVLSQLVLSSSGHRVVSLLSRYELHASSGMHGCHGSLMAALGANVYLCTVAGLGVFKCLRMPVDLCPLHL